ncbi:MAG TPA: hypothetical protein V6C52_02445 [Coleofasciculaceae cyanobacterium]|jgi:hypothetical protein
MIMTGSMTQDELERLLEDSRKIAQDWDTYLQFRQNRDAVLQELMHNEGKN